MNEQRIHWDARYREGTTPWNTGITPPEVVEFWNRGLSRDTVTAIDLGCGSGTNAAFLAAKGMTVIALDHSGIALEMARKRIAVQLLDYRARISFIQADVARLPVFNASAFYILDIGCLHALPSETRDHYVFGVSENLAPGGFYHLFAFDRIDTESGERDRGMGPSEVIDLFTPALEVTEIRRGNPDHKPCRWYLLQKPR